MTLLYDTLANVHAENEFNLSSKEAHKERMNKLKSLLNELEEVCILFNILILNWLKLWIYIYFEFLGQLEVW
jgi:hypothetical protein